jgi:hypothetical protein
VAEGDKTISRVNRRALRSTVSVFAPPARLEPATTSLARLVIPLIEEGIRFPHVICRNKEKKELHPLRSPLCNLALVAFAF